MPRYVAVRPIHIGGALAFAPGAPVPESHVERFDLLDDGIDGPAVTAVGEDSVGHRPDLIVGLPDTTPPTVSIGQRLLYGDPKPDADVATDAPKTTTKTSDKPAAGTNTTTVTEG
jgi:hypothetical protein